MLQNVNMYGIHKSMDILDVLVRDGIKTTYNFISLTKYPFLFSVAHVVVGLFRACCQYLDFHS